MNLVALVGRPTKDVELRFTPQGKAVASTTLAVQQNFVNQNTGKREADFIQVVIWGKRAEAFANHVRKGHKVSVSGRIATRNYDELKDGQPTGKKVYLTEVLADDFGFLENKEA